MSSYGLESIINRAIEARLNNRKYEYDSADIDEDESRRRGRNQGQGLSVSDRIKQISENWRFLGNPKTKDGEEAGESDRFELLQDAAKLYVSQAFPGATIAYDLLFGGGSEGGSESED